ncbi:Hypothetical protein GLP15_177 [Giardia lamblia P15]|uniref:Uncharacterized protein n=1 Tax=Giardia intestinalis (strain P15) TaxID=658858 RepID=E1F3I6_GIAIA|nr:Hypothetical protein GLP15_177 [Giardia lamblia P15]
MANRLKPMTEYVSSYNTTGDHSTPRNVSGCGSVLKQTRSSFDRRTRRSPHRPETAKPCLHRQRDDLVIHLSNGPDQVTSPFINTPKSNRPSSAISVLPPDVEASLTCLLAAAKSFSTVMTHYDLNDLTRIREASASFKDIKNEDENAALLRKRHMETTRDLSLSNLYPTKCSTNSNCTLSLSRPTHTFNLLRASSKYHADNKSHTQLEALQYEIDQSIKKCKSDFQTLVPPTDKAEIESRHFPAISFSLTSVSSTEASDVIKVERLGNLLLSERVPAIILGRSDFSLARKLVAIELDTVSMDCQLLIYTLKTQTKMGSVKLCEMVSLQRTLADADVDLLDVYGVSLFDLNVMKTSDMTELIEFKGLGSSFALLLSEQHAKSLLAIFDKALTK